MIWHAFQMWNLCIFIYLFLNSNLPNQSENLKTNKNFIASHVRTSFENSFWMMLSGNSLCKSILIQII